jgi:hypothetical protein
MNAFRMTKAALVVITLVGAAGVGLGVAIGGAIGGLVAALIAAVFLVAGLGLAITIAVDGLTPAAATDEQNPPADPFWDAVGRVIRDADRRARKDGTS